MEKSILMIVLLATTSSGGGIPDDVVEKQNASFQRWWNEDFVWKFADLPTQGDVPEFRVPYSGYIYPDHAGGTSGALRKYDAAFNSGHRHTATEWEKWDTTSNKKPVKGLLGFLGVQETPTWHGHCNGWTSASIRHAEPQRSVGFNGILFTPSDIKALLAEIYMYNDSDMLAGLDHRLNAGTFHAILANWLGRGSHPLGLEADPGEEKWNYPLHAYASAFTYRSPHQVEVNTNIRYAVDSEEGEYDESPAFSRVLFFHYVLDLNERGEIVGGQFFDDSSLVDMFWVPLRPQQAGQQGNEGGNPQINVDWVLALWRTSVLEEKRTQWMNVDPTERDRVLVLSEQPQLVAKGSKVKLLSPPPVEPPFDPVPPVDVLVADPQNDSPVSAPAAINDSPRETVASRRMRPRVRVLPDRSAPVKPVESGVNTARWLN